MTDTSWLQTYTGKKFFPLNPQIELICIEDIAHSLSMQCRFNGHTKSFYSVAQHSVLLSNWLDGYKYRRYGLLHDASEAYLSDIPRPLKQLPEFNFYREAEFHLQEMIYRRFGLDGWLPNKVTVADKQICDDEAVWLMSPLHPDWKAKAQGMYDISQFQTWSPNKAKHTFLELFHFLFGEKENDR